MSDLTEQEHEYFHKLIWLLTNEAEPKFVKGAAEHRSKGNLWEMSDADLETAIHDELIDLMIYNAEKIRRQHE